MIKQNIDSRHVGAGGEVGGENEKVLLQRISEEYGMYVAGQIKGVGEDYEYLVKRGKMTNEERLEKLGAVQEKYAKAGVVEKIKFLTNNFYCWLPGGHYRDLLKKRQNTESSDAEKTKNNLEQRLVERLDEIIVEMGLGGETETMRSIFRGEAVVSDDSKELVMKNVAKLYLGMVDSGYDGKKLRG